MEPRNRNSKYFSTQILFYYHHGEAVVEQNLYRHIRCVFFVTSEPPTTYMSLCISEGRRVYDMLSLPIYAVLSTCDKIRKNRKIGITSDSFIF